jgi:succinate dehydrogenase / fumarate reductase flavoprotein subunit
MWDHVGMGRNEAGLRQALASIPELRDQFWREVVVPSSGEEFSQILEYAGRVADYLELGELIALDALERRESCGGHFREESQTPDNEARRDDEHFTHAAAWEFAGEGALPIRNIEPLSFDYVKPSQRSYK